jgi:CheY-like chemotaxis protein
VSDPGDDDPVSWLHDDEVEAPTPPRRPPWPVLLVDDDDAVLMVSALAFDGQEVDGRPLEVLTARSAAEARAVLTRRADIAVAIIDVVMESEEAGLALIDWAHGRDALAAMRVVIRTGQPGRVPEGPLRARPDVHDYWPKAELTATQARARLAAQLRAHDDVRRARDAAEALTVWAYTSCYLGEAPEADIDAIARESARRNERDGITGALLFDRGRFVQVVEGPPRAVDDLRARLTRDPRHGDLRTLLATPCAVRAFHGWEMTARRLDRDDPPDAAALLRLRDAYLGAFRLDPQDFIALVSSFLDDAHTPPRERA